MEITHVTTITLEKSEIVALQTLKDAYMQCIVDDNFDDNFECENCPLYVDKICVGEKVEKALDRQGCR